MVSFRNFAASLLAVLIAVIIGAVIGSGALTAMPQAPGSGPKEGSAQSSGEHNASLPNGSGAGREEGDKFARAVGGRAVAGVLSGQSVVVITAPGAEQGDVDAVQGYLNAAGAQLSGHIGLTDAFVGTADEAKLRTVVDNIIPPGAPLDPNNVDQQSRVGDVIGAVLAPQTQDVVKPEERANAINLLRVNGYLSVAQDPAPAAAAVIVTGGALPADSGDKGPAVARFAKALRARLPAVVVAGRSGSSDGSAAVAQVRADQAARLSAVDDLDGPMGQVAAVLAVAEQLQGHVGQYGTGNGAAALAPSIG